MSLAAYRSLLRAAKVAFNGDTRILTAAQTKIRNDFRENLALDVSDPSVQSAIKHAEEIALFLRSNVVQGKRVEDGVYKLRIHKDTERGDNDTIKYGDQIIKIDGKTCSDK